jgi:hypothetical protein
MMRGQLKAKGGDNFATAISSNPVTYQINAIARGGFGSSENPEAELAVLSRRLELADEHREWS